MSTAPRPTTANKQAASKKLMSLLKKRYKTPLPPGDRPVLDTMLHAVCLEDSTDEEAEETLQRLKSLFHDLNEVRVSSISELAVAFDGVPNAERKALRIRAALQYVFEKNYVFDFENLRKKTLDLAIKQLAKIKELSPFVRSYTLQAALGGHLVPIDESMIAAAVWLGLLPVNATAEQAASELKSVIRKNEAAQFCHLLRCLARDPLLAKTFERARSKPPAEGFNLADATRRLEALYTSAAKMARSAKKRPVAGKSGTTSKVVKRAKTSSTAAKKTSSGAAGRLVAKKNATKKSGGSHVVRKKK
jgi:endonuclease-3